MHIYDWLYHILTSAISVLSKECFIIPCIPLYLSQTFLYYYILPSLKKNNAFVNLFSETDHIVDTNDFDCSNSFQVNPKGH